MNTTMARLTEEMVIARTRASDLSNIRKLNCWGSELSDVSLLRRMQNVEVLALSVNKIVSLSDFQFCRNLQELYVRKNEIQDLNQVLYLQDLPRLKNLWLEENPCATTDAYRMTVLKALPQLQKLDNVPVQPEEVQDAARRGRELVHPEEEQQWPSETSSPVQSPTREERRSEDADSAQHRQEDSSYYDTDRRNANYESEPTAYQTRQQSVQYNASYERSPTTSNHTEATSPCDSVREDVSLHSPGSAIPMKDVSPNSEDGYRVRSERHHGDSSSEGSLASLHGRAPRPAEEEVGVPEERYRQPPTLGPLNNRPPLSRRPVTRVWNSNILSAVLCLIKELDYPSLEVVEMAVRSRMDEF